MSLLEVKSLNRSFGGLRAVQDVSFCVERNVIKAIIGPNGAGKTTLFNLISGTLAPDAGVVRMEGAQIQGQPPYRIARHGISRTFQNIKLFPHMTVLENVMVGRHIRSKAGFASAMLRLPHSRREERAIREKSAGILRILGIHELADREATSLPFGKQRVVELGRALATEPSLILLDEPAAGLNIHETVLISELIMKICGQGITVLVIEHDMSLVMNISNEIVVLSSGSKIAEGTPDEIQQNDEVIRVYLGEEDA
jgi:branched-chain amino acid transport system ATP-binding protein